MKTPKRINSGKYSRFQDVTKEWLEYHYGKQGKSCQEIGDIIGAHKDTIKKWVRDYEIKRLPVCQLGENGPYKYIDGKRIHYEGVTKEWLEYQYITLDKSTVDILEEFGISRPAFARWLRDFGIVKQKSIICEKHSKRMSDNGNPAYTNGMSGKYQKIRLRKSGKPEICDWCGTIEDIQIHHIDHDRQNGNLENLTWLCGYCNRLESNLWALQDRATFTFDSKRIIIDFMDTED